MEGVCEGECIGRSSRDEHLPLTRCHSCGLSQLSLEGCYLYVAEIINGDFSDFLLFLKLCFSFTVTHFLA